MIFYLCIALNINILLSSELCWCETTTFFTLLSHYQPPPNVHTCTTTWRPKRISTTHISCTLRLQHSWTDGRSKCTHHGGPLSTNCCLFFCEQRRTNCNRKKNIYIPVFVPRSFCTATWCDHGEFNTLFLFLLLAVFLLPLLSCYNILYLFCSNPTTHRVNRFVYLKVFLFELLTCHIPVIKMTQYITIRDVVTHDKRCLGAVHVSSFRLCLAGASKRLEVL